MNAATTRTIPITLTIPPTPSAWNDLATQFRHLWGQAIQDDLYITARFFDSVCMAAKRAINDHIDDECAKHNATKPQGSPSLTRLCPDWPITGVHNFTDVNRCIEYFTGPNQETHAHFYVPHSQAKELWTSIPDTDKAIIRTCLSISFSAYTDKNLVPSNHLL